MDENTRILIEQLAAKLGTTADALWQILVQQAFISGIGNLIGCLVIICILLVWIRYQKKTEFEDENPFPYVAWALVLIATVIGLPIFLYSAISCFLNPEYFALSEIMRLL